ncbi:hypothetical protein [Lentilactobacillus laojiaonis]|uniref:hypothetical protein n=1 Tax=Lentilactobacillus laojiaonis TaxID=2883998 RepID=UPI001D0A005E|nr:hypothetical protein [Lentilactobacillus laojiaonis]UDM32559.1 hypothetical protein LHL71_02310 [Lentilactobacillus laojiaonis]
MDEAVFFNPQNSIGNFHDHNEAVQSAKIYKLNNQDESIFVVNDDNHDYQIFLGDDIITHPSKNQQSINEKEYIISDKF